VHAPPWRRCGRDPIEVFEPRLFPIEGGAVTLYAGDAGYADAEIERPGPRHRLWIRDGRLALRAYLNTDPCDPWFRFRGR
jgi:hypothetical protein